MEKDHPEFCPIVMKEVTFDVIATFMAGKKDNEGKYYGKSTYDGIRSSLMHLYTMSNVTPTEEFRARMATFMKGFKRTIIGQKVENGESLEEGKEVMSFECLSLAS